MKDNEYVCAIFFKIYATLFAALYATLIFPFVGQMRM